MATIASLNVNLGMSTAGFSAGSKRARKEVLALSQVVTGVSSAMAIANTATNAIQSGLNNFAQASEAIDSLSKMAERTGFATENLGALHYAASLAGVDIGGFDAAIQKMNINLAKAADGGAAGKAFEDLKLNAKELIAASPEQTFGKIADAINRLPTPAQKAAAARRVSAARKASLAPSKAIRPFCFNWTNSAAISRRWATPEIRFSTTSCKSCCACSR